MANKDIESNVSNSEFNTFKNIITSNLQMHPMYKSPQSTYKKGDINFSFMNPFQRLPIYLVLIIFSVSTFSCNKFKKGKGELLEVINTSFGNEIEEQSNLTFTFNQPLIQNDTLLNQWFEADYFKLEPEVVGKYKWDDYHQLTFSPSKGFEKATAYKLTFNRSLLKVNKKLKEWKGLKTYEFSTPYLELKEAFAFWTKENNEVIAQINLGFNIQVSSETLKNHLKVEINKKNYPFEIIPNSSSKEHLIRLTEVPDKTKKENVKITLDVIDKISKESSSKSSSLESIDKLKIAKVEVNESIRVYTSQLIEMDALKEMLSITPNVNYSSAPTSYGFEISSKEFNVNDIYTITIKAGLEGALGGKLKNDYVEQISFGNVTPEIAFDDQKAIYLGKNGFKNVSVKISGVSKVKVSVYKVFENNLLHFLYRGKEYGYYYNYDDENYDYHSYYYYETSDVGQLIHEEDISTESLDEIGISRLLNLDFTDKLQDKDGIYVIKVQDSDKYYISDSKMISLSDIGLIAKQDKNSLYVFCNSIKTATPLGSTTIKLISSHNQEITTMVTTNDGIAKFDRSTFPEGFIPKLVIAKNGTDYNFMNLDNSEYLTARFDVGGKRLGESTYDLFFYAERSLYRPGETIHLAGVIRDFDWQKIAQLPVHIKLRSPQGKEFASYRGQVDAQGMFAADFPTDANSMTGTYIAEAYTGKDIFLGSKTIQVEEFMPDRIKVELELKKTQYAIKDTIKGNITAINYFGPPAANNKYETQLAITQGIFSPKKYTEFNFAQRESLVDIVEYADGKTDANGKAPVKFLLSEKLAQNGLLNGRVYTTVFDETGRPVHRAQRFQIFSQKVFLGVKAFDEWVSTKKPIEIELIALTKDEKTVSQAVEIEVLQYSWYSTLRFDNGQYRYVSEKETNIISRQKVTISGENTKYIFTPKNSGSYEVIVRIPKTKIEISRTFYAYSFNDSHHSAFEVNNEGNIDISFDKENYQPGENAVAILKLPFDGKVLLTTERDEVIDYKYVDSKNKVITYNIKVSDKNVPNTYVTATLFKPHDGSSSLPLTVAHGFASFEVKPNKAKLNLTVTAAEKSRSNTKQKITINTEPNTHLTVAVVDEGILALGNQKTPNPYDYFYAKRALEVGSSDIYPFLFPEITATGGDEADLAAEMANRQNPLQNKRVKLVSFWSNLLKTDSKGNVTFEVDIPQFSGSLRVMAVASKDHKFGSIDKNITVADPLVISSSVPRFLSMGDEWKMKVNLTNTTGKAISGKIEVKTTGPVKPGALSANTVTIPANSAKEVELTVKAGYQIGEAKITTSVVALNEQFTEVTDITIRPAASLVKNYQSGMIKAGKNQKIDLTNAFLANTGKHQIFISKSPLAQFTNDIDELIAYPFGCVEQTISKAFPQLYFEDLVSAIYADKKEFNANEIKRNVQVAIDKVKMMQLSNGGLSYWPNNGEETWWGTIYAAHFLIEARDKGYQVNKKTLDRMLSYLQDRLKTKEKITYYYNGAEKREIVKKEIGYSLYVLALAGKPDYAGMKHYLNNTDELSLDTKYLIACAFILTDDIAAARKIMPTSFSGEKSVPTFGGSFYSYTRDLAISTNALIQVQPDHPQIPEMIRMLSAEMSRQRYLNTQEMSFGFLAMGKYARLKPIGKSTAVIKNGDKTLGEFTGKDIWLKKIDSKLPLTIEVAGEGNLYYFVESEGIPLDDKVKNVDNFLKVRRTYYTKEKREITNGQFKQNDLIVVKITLESLTGASIENVAITDILPAGFEIENARITEMPELSWANTEMNYDYRDIRDDRIHFFTTAGNGVQTFYYLARAVTPGTYQLGPVSADAMYNGAYHSYYGSGKVVVK
jgi:uncharacterized protein YfaS (alpha-2-macroglobulin family)